MVVKYSVGVDGNGYSEKRRIIKNYGSDKGNVTVPVTPTTSTTATSTSTVVSKIITQLKPTIISIIRSTVQASNLENLDSDRLVKTIVIQLRPVVFAAAQEAITSSGSTSLNPGDLTDVILVQITPFVEEGVRTEVAEIQKQDAGAAPTVSVDQFVSSIISSLRPTVVRIISSSVASSNVDLTNYQNLVGEILTRLRPVVLTTGQTSLAM